MRSCRVCVFRYDSSLYMVGLYGVRWTFCFLYVQWKISHVVWFLRLLLWVYSLPVALALRVSKGISLWLDREFLALPCNAWRKRPIELWYFCLNTLGKANLFPSIFSALSFSVAASSALRIVLASPPLSALSIGTRVFCTGTRSSHYTLHSEPTYPASGHPTSVAGWRMRSVLLCHCQGNSRFGYRLPICFPLSRGWKRSWEWRNPVHSIVGVADCSLLGWSGTRDNPWSPRKDNRRFVALFAVGYGWCPSGRHIPWSIYYALHTLLPYSGTVSYTHLTLPTTSRV